jgi:hypothetical protein
MINSFIVKALPENNRLVILLDGYFMNSEVDLTLDLIDNECGKLTKGFAVFLDLRNLEMVTRDYPKYLKRVKERLDIQGCGEVVVKGAQKGRAYLNQSSVGLYPYEIGWNLL